MTNEKKQLLFKDLCARLPYGVKVQNVLNGSIYDLKEHLHCLPGALVTNFKPFLRPMSSMTEDEIEELKELTGTNEANQYGFSYSNLIGECFGMKYDDCSELVDWLNAHHFDYRGLIEKGLALEAPEGMYEIFRAIDIFSN